MANDSTGPLPSEDNINSMEAAQRAQGTNIILLLDEPGDGNSRILDVRYDQNPDQTPIVSVEVEDNGEVIGPSDEVNTGEASTLSDFVTFTASHWPADRYALVLWGHGAGWDGLCLDVTDLLNLVELKEGLTDACTILGRSLDIITVDACVEATFETLYQLRDVADYVVAAQTNIPYQGLPYYQILTALALDPEMGPAGFGRVIVDEYIAWSAIYAQDSATLAVFDLGYATATAEALTNLAVEGLRYDGIFHSTIQSAMASAEYYDTEWAFDVGDFLRQLSGAAVPLEVRALATDAFLAYSNMVTCFDRFDHPDPLDGIGVKYSTGAIIYAPSGSIFDARYQDLDIATTLWDEFGKAARLVTQTNASKPGPSIAYGDTDSDGWQDQATLAWTDTYASVTAWIFRVTPNGMTHLKTYSSATGMVTIFGIAGEFIVSASADENGSAVSHSSLSLTLFGASTIEVQLLRGGAPVSEGYDVRVLSTDLIDYAEASSGKFYLRLTIPTQATVGQLIQIEVFTAEGEMVSTSHAFVPDDYLAVEIELVSERAKPETDSDILLLFSVLPGMFVLVFAIMMYLDFRKKQRAT